MNKYHCSSVIPMKVVNKNGASIYISSINVHCDRMSKELTRIVCDAIQDRRDLADQLGIDFSKDELVLLREALMASFLLAMQKSFRENGYE